MTLVAKAGPMDMAQAKRPRPSGTKPLHLRGFAKKPPGSGRAVKGFKLVEVPTGLGEDLYTC